MQQYTNEQPMIPAVDPGLVEGAVVTLYHGGDRGKYFVTSHDIARLYRVSHDEYLVLVNETVNAEARSAARQEYKDGEKNHQDHCAPSASKKQVRYNACHSVTSISGHYRRVVIVLARQRVTMLNSYSVLFFGKLPVLGVCGSSNPRPV